MKKTIYITRLSAFQLVCGGMARLQVWLECPYYTEPYYYQEIDYPFGSEREIGCFAKRGWQLHHSNFQNSIPFNQLFGYDSDFSKEVWKKVYEHFGNTDFRKWEKYEKENENCSIKNFFLKYDIEIKI
jgi:hypothetical protein